MRLLREAKWANGVGIGLVAAGLAWIITRPGPTTLVAIFAAWLLIGALV